MQESCLSCDFAKMCLTKYDIKTKDELDRGCPFWQGWHELRCTCPIKPDEGVEVTIVIMCGETNAYCQARLTNNEWHLSNGKVYMDDSSCPISAWRELTYKNHGGLEIFI